MHQRKEPKNHTMNSFRKHRDIKISETLEMSLHNYNIIKQGLQSKSKVDQRVMG